jgi:hypothetical protein
MNLENVIQRYYEKACETLHGIATDTKMKLIMQGKIAFDSEHAKKWMRNYALFQGMSTSERQEIVNTVERSIGQVNQTQIANDRETLIPQRFTLLFSELYHTVNRSWLSATSKLLWCAFPDDIVIYDSFVERAIVVLQSFDDDLYRLPRLGKKPTISSTADIRGMVDYYSRYQTMVFTLFKKNQPVLSKLRKEHGETYPHNIRILDNILWLASKPD